MLPIKLLGDFNMKLLLCIEVKNIIFPKFILWKKNLKEMSIYT